MNGNNKSSMTVQGTVGGLTALFILSFVTFLFLSMGGGILALPFFGGAVGMLTFMLMNKRYLSLVVPCISAIVCVNNIIAAGVCLAAIYMCSILFAIIIDGGVESFSFFMLTTLAYAVIFGAVYVLVTAKAYGTFAAGMEALKAELIAQAAQRFADNKEYRDLAVSAMEMSVYLLPAMVFWAGAVVSLITGKTIRSAVKRTADSRKPYTKITRAPAVLGIMFLFLSLFGMFMSGSNETMYYAVLNLTGVLSFIFMIEGFKEYSAMLSSPGSGVKKVVCIAAAVMIFMYFFAGIVLIAALFGSTRIILRGMREMLEKIVKDGSDDNR